MKTVKVVPFLIETDGRDEELICKVVIYEDGAFKRTSFRRYPSHYTYDDIEADVAAELEADSVVVQYSWCIERRRVQWNWEI